jgi:phosphoesterase RecJ-like protein
MMIDLLDVLDCEVTGGEGGVAEPLYVGMATDTGWFRYENAQARTFAMAARLLEHGVDKSRLYQLIEETHPVERLRLEARALASLEFVCGDSVAIQSLRMRDFEETGCTVENLTGVVNLPMIARKVRVAVLLSEVRPNHTKLSFRAKPALGEMTAIDVNELAGMFGGGGHVLASGARLDLPLEQARERLLDALSC